MHRRTFLGASTALAATATAGCLDQFMSTPRAPPTVADRPDAVYVPSHVEGMKMVGMGSAGDYGVGLMYSFPHRFWNVTGDRLEKAKPTGDVHLMGTVWDPETRTVLPVGNVQATVSKGGSEVVSRPLWPMLSQNMGLHFGDNFGLDGTGTYEVTLSVDPLGATAAGGFRGQFDGNASATFTMQYSESTRDEITFERLNDRQGKKAALEPMTGKMKMPVSRVPKRGALPGDFVGQGKSGDAVFYVETLASPPNGVTADDGGGGDGGGDGGDGDGGDGDGGDGDGGGGDGDGAGDGAGGRTYLYVSPRTPYNRYPLPFMGLTATVERGGETVFDGNFSAVIHPETGYHYGAVLDSLQSGDQVTISPSVPPQVARHEGYETAFVQFDDLSTTVP